MNKNAEKFLIALSEIGIPFRYGLASDTGNPMVTINGESQEQITIFIHDEDCKMGPAQSFVRVNKKV